MLSAVPSVRAPPELSEEELFWAIPSANVSNWNEAESALISLRIVVEDAAVNEPEATLVTNKEVPPFWK